MIDLPDVSTLIRSVAPDLADVPLYVRWASDIPPELWRQRAVAVTSASLDITLRPWLQDRGEWFGRGRAIVIDRSYLIADAGTDDDDIIRPRIVGALAHELGHALAEPVDLAETPAAIDQAKFYQETTQLPPGPVFFKRVPPFLGHDGVWVRSLLHVCHRFSQQGQRVIPALTGWHLFQLSHLHEYADALAGEPDRMASASFAEIRATPVPEAFLNLWRDDCLRWFHSLDDTALADWALLDVILNCFRKDT